MVSILGTTEHVKILVNRYGNFVGAKKIHVFGDTVYVYHDNATQKND